MTYNKWVKVFLMTSIFVFLIVSCINFIINPYNVFAHGYDKYFSNKTEILSGEMTTFYVANRVKPKTIMIGTSRIGFFSAEDLKQYVDGPIYNMSLAGSSIDEQAAYIEYMIKYHHVKNIIWSLDFFSFNPTKPINPSFESERLSNNIYWNDYLISLFSFKTLNKSVKTLMNSVLHQNDKIHDQPFDQPTVEANIHSTLEEYARGKEFLKSETFKNPSSIDSKIAILKKTILLCKKNNVSCILYTSPVYYKHINMYYTLGLGNTFEYWKKSLAYVQPYVDFCTDTNLSHDTMKFRDSTHAVGSVGKLVFARIFHKNTNDLPQDFGVFITNANIQSHLTKLRNDRIKCQNTHPQDAI